MSDKVIGGDYQNGQLSTLFGKVQILPSMFQNAIPINAETVMKYELVNPNDYIVSIYFKNGAKSLVQASKKSYPKLLGALFDVDKKCDRSESDLAGTVKIEETDLKSRELDAIKPTNLEDNSKKRKSRKLGCLTLLVIFLFFGVFFRNEDKDNKTGLEASQKVVNTVEKRSSANEVTVDLNIGKEVRKQTPQEETRNAPSDISNLGIAFETFVRNYTLAQKKYGAIALPSPKRNESDDNGEKQLVQYQFPNCDVGILSSYQKSNQKLLEVAVLIGVDVDKNFNLGRKIFLACVQAVDSKLSKKEIDRIFSNLGITNLSVFVNALKKDSSSKEYIYRGKKYSMIPIIPYNIVTLCVSVK